MSTSDPFALALHFYVQYQRNKLHEREVDETIDRESVRDTDTDRDRDRDRGRHRDTDTDRDRDTDTDRVRDRETENDQLLSKVHQKYSSRPQSLPLALAKKYSPHCHVAQRVSHAAVLKYVSLLHVPEAFKASMTQRDSDLAKALQKHRYRPSRDPYSVEFDALAVLQDASGTDTDRGSSLSCSSSSTAFVFTACSSQMAGCLDNTHRFTTLLTPFCEQVGVDRQGECTQKEEFELALRDNSIVTMNLVHELKGPPPAQTSSAIQSSTFIERKPLFDTIADYATQSAPSRNRMGEMVQVDSPLNLIKQFMVNKERVRVILRRKTSIRGHLDGYIRAFDKHFNMLMYDVDEEYITNKQKKRTTGFGVFLNQHNVLHRHLPQLIVRGDIVVSVLKVPRTPILLPVADLSLSCFILPDAT